MSKAGAYGKRLPDSVQGREGSVSGKLLLMAEFSPVVSVARKTESQKGRNEKTHRVQDADMCVKGTVEGLKIWWLVDTGNSISILSLGEYGKIPRSQRPALEP